MEEQATNNRILTLEQVNDILTRGTRRDLNWEVMSPKVISLPFLATLASDCSAGNHFRVVLRGNVTLSAPTNARDGQRLVWEFIQDNTGSRTVTLNSVFDFGTDITSFTATTTANARDFLGCIYNKAENKFYVVAVSKGY